MTVKDAINAVRVMLGQEVATEEVTIEAPQTEEVAMEEVTEEVVETELEEDKDEEAEGKKQFAETALVDGTVVYTEGELAPGAVLYVSTDEEEDPMAPEGKHQTVDGMIVTVIEGGIIESIEEVEAEDVEAEAKDEEPKEEFNKEEFVAAVSEVIKEYADEVVALKEEISVLTERFEAVADMPATKPIKKSFMEEAKAAKEVANARFDRLVSIRNNK